MKTTLLETKNKGVIVRAVGVVVDVAFETGDLPSIHNALIVHRDQQKPLVLEVEEHRDSNVVRTIAMGSTAGIRRGLIVEDTGESIKVPVGRPTLGRMFNVLGEPIDEKGPLDDVVRKNIHVKSPPLNEQRVVSTPFITGIKAIDLLIPYPQGEIGRASCRERV